MPKVQETNPAAAKREAVELRQQAEGLIARANQLDPPKAKSSKKKSSTKKSSTKQSKGKKGTKK